MLEDSKSGCSQSHLIAFGASGENANRGMI